MTYVNRGRIRAFHTFSRKWTHYQLFVCQCVLRKHRVISQPDTKDVNCTIQVYHIYLKHFDKVKYNEKKSKQRKSCLCIVPIGLRTDKHQGQLKTCLGNAKQNFPLLSDVRRPLSKWFQSAAGMSVPKIWYHNPSHAEVHLVAALPPPQPDKKPGRAVEQAGKGEYLDRHSHPIQHKSTPTRHFMLGATPPQIRVINDRQSEKLQSQVT